MKLALPNFVTTRVAQQSLVLQKNSPKILFYSGLLLMGATVVTASRSTLRLGDVLDDIRADREDVQHVATTTNDYDSREIAKLNLYISARGVTRIVRLYLPAVTLGVAAVACLTTSHNQLTRRNAGLSAALVATERALDNYRSRIREEFGEERENELWRGEKTIERPVLDDEGRETKSKAKVKVGGGYSPYARIWGRDTSNEWDPQPAYNIAKLRSVQEYCTLRLNARGHLFLNEVFDELGLDRTPAGAVVGWKSTKYGGNDGFVDFGVLNRDPETESRFLDFMTGDEEHILLDFNVDGEIWRNI